MPALIWLDDAESALATAYLAARAAGIGDRFTQAVQSAEELLWAAPATVGESRGRRRRFIIYRPAAITYEVHEPEAVVVVLTVHFFVPRRS